MILEKKTVQEGFEISDGMPKKKINIDFRSQFDFAQNAKCYVGNKGGSLISPDKRINSSSSNYIESNNLEKRTSDPPPKFKIGKYTMEVEFYRNDEEAKSFWVYQILDENGEVVDCKDKDFMKFIQEQYGYENLDDMILKEQSLTYDLSNNKLMFRLPNSQFTQTQPINTDSIKSGENPYEYTEDGINTHAISSDNFDYIAQAEEIYNLLMEDIKNNPEKIKEHIDMLTPDNIEAFWEKWYDQSFDATDHILDAQNLSNKDKEYFCKKVAECYVKKFENEGLYVKDLKKDMNDVISEIKENNFHDSSKQFQACIKDWFYGIFKYRENNQGQYIARLLMQDIYAKNTVGLPTTGEKFENHINLINSDNVMGVMLHYEVSNPDAEDKETLVSAIIKERGLDYGSRVKYINHIVDALIESAERKSLTHLNTIKEEIKAELKKQGDTWWFANEDFINARVRQLLNRIEAVDEAKLEDRDISITNPNGKIDQHFRQGNTDDCWLLAAIKALAMQPKGLKILNDSIKVDDKNQTVTVTLKGPNKSYKFTFSELNAATELSSGDGDIRAIEMAVNKYFKEEGSVRGQPDINGNYEHVAYRILTGKGGKNWFSDTFGRFPDIWFTDSQIDNFNKTNRVTCVGRTLGKDKEALATMNDGIIVKLSTLHAYAVKGSDKEYVYLVDPRYTSTVLCVSREVFKDFFNQMDQFDL